MDLRGHGDSDWSNGGEYELRDFSEDVAFLIDTLGIQPSLVGASLGGLVGIYLEGRYSPGSISDLVLVDIVPNINVVGAEKIKDFMLEHSKQDLRLCRKFQIFFPNTTLIANDHRILKG